MSRRLSVDLGEGLEEYYELRRRFSDRPETAVDPELVSHSFVDFDTPRFIEQNGQRLSGGRLQTTFAIARNSLRGLRVVAGTLAPDPARRDRRASEPGQVHH